MKRGKVYSFTTGGALWLSAGVVSNCVIRDNHAYYSGGAHITGGLLTDSVVFNCSAPSSAGAGGGLRVVGGEVANCVISNNTSSINGGGVYMTGGLLRDSLIAGNYASGGSADKAGGIWMSGGVVEFNTVVNNMAGNSGGGVMRTGGGITNSVICLNTAPTGSDIDGTAGFGHCVSPGLTSGIGGNIKGTPLFRDAAAGDYSHHGIYSSGVNAGAKLPWARQAVDLNGGPRWIGGAPDMGAYESLSVAGTMLMLR